MITVVLPCWMVRFSFRTFFSLLSGPNQPARQAINWCLHWPWNEHNLIWIYLYFDVLATTAAAENIYPWLSYLIHTQTTRWQSGIHFEFNRNLNPMETVNWTQFIPHKTNSFLFLPNWKEFHSTRKRCYKFNDENIFTGKNVSAARARARTHSHQHQTSPSWLCIWIQNKGQ